MIVVIVLGQSIPGTEGFGAQCAGVGHVQVHLHMPPHLGFVRHCLATGCTLVLGSRTFFVPCYHGLQRIIER